MGSQQESRLAKLQDVGRQLVVQDMLATDIQRDLNQVNQRWTALNQKV